MLEPLPTTTSSFPDIIGGDYLYIDKTRHLYEVVKHPKGAYFLSRPRRFGKSLLLSTLEELFRGNRDLFRGLWIDQSDYQWQTHPVIRLDFGQEPTHSAEGLVETIDAYLSEIAAAHDIELQDGPYYRRFRHLIQKLAKEKPVVILIDEYDKPLLENLENLPEAKKIRDTLKAFYAVIKAMDRYVRLSFITGISKFSKVGVFSDLNNLTDLTMNGTFATALGLTEAEIRHNLATYIHDFAQKEGISLDECIYLFEFKLDKSAQIALEQINQHAYYQKYQLHGKPITCVGANFATNTRTIDDWKSLEVAPL